MQKAMSEIAIPTVLEVGKDKMSNIGVYLNKVGLSKVIVCFGEGIRDMFGTQVIDAIQSQKSVELLDTYDYDDIKLERIAQKAFSLPAHVEAIIGVGGGKVLDIAKYIAHLNNLPFISIPTSTSHDGFASAGCSLIVNERRTSVPARIPFGIIVDIGIIKNSPDKFIYSGIGDLISKITAVYDWQFEERNGKTKVNDFAVMIAKKSVNSIARMPYTSIKEDFFLKELVDSLTMSGIAMEIAGNSAPASGSEHLISHAMDKLLEKPYLHGTQVGVATYIMSMVQEHRYERVRKFLTDTGFFDHVETLGMKAEDFIKAIDLAPTIKPNRYTFVHIPEYREKAKQLVKEDEILKRILH
ncbi:MAG: iron-containing alcohol dehydrogenase family protein [Clostridia bacterium]|nr:iron-containing alcohol dehydrogenase family protein [Clostridia bacterium]